MNIVVAVRCLNEIHNIERFMKGYAFANSIVVSDGGSVDGSVEMLEKLPVHLVHFTGGETVNGEFWNTDGPHINFVLNEAKKLDPDWIIFDDMDDVPNRLLRENARSVLESCPKPQINVSRLYMWGEDRHFPKLCGYYTPEYRSLWAWKPKEINIRADENIKHGTIVGVTADNFGVDIPMCLLHKSYSPDTIQKKIERYNKLGLPFNHPFDWAGELQNLPEWAVE